VLTNPKHEAFAQAIAGGHSAAEAYRAHISDKGSAKTSHEEASRIANFPKVSARIAELRSAVAKIAKKEFNFTKADLLRWHLKVLRKPVGKIDQNHPLCQEWTRDEIQSGDGKPPVTRIKVKMVPKMESAKQIAIMCGWNAADENGKKGADALADALAIIREATHGSRKP